jgi:uronate dehydrogenase
MAAKKVLITGSAGRIGRAATQALVERGHFVTGLDLKPTPGLAPRQCMIGSLTDPALARRAIAGQEVVIHLAATPDDANYPRQPPPNDGDNFLTELLPNNIVAGYHLLEAARQAQTPRLVLASTGQTLWHRIEEGPWPVDEHTPYAPRYWYACTKIFLEAAAMAYSRAHGLEVVMVRLGWCPRDAGQLAEIAACERYQDVFLSPGDAGRFFVCCVEASELPAYSLVYATSRPRHRCRYDLNQTARLLGFLPQETWPANLLAAP